jgi:hypothetical protein
MRLPILKTQEIAFDSPESRYMFQPTEGKPFLATPAPITAYQHESLVACLWVLQEHASGHNGLDYLQVFEDSEQAEALWFIEDDIGGAITALLPLDY